MSNGFTPDISAERSTTPVQPDEFFPAVNADECARLMQIDPQLENAVLDNALMLAVLEANNDLKAWQAERMYAGEDFTTLAGGKATLYKNAVYSATKAASLRDVITTDRRADAESAANSTDTISYYDAQATKLISSIIGRRRIGVHSV